MLHERDIERYRRMTVEERLKETFELSDLDWSYLDSLAGLRKMSMRIPVDEKSVVVDVFVTATDFQREAFARRRPHKYEGSTLTICSPEDLLIHKLLASRPRDRSDIADLLLVTGPL